MNQEQVKYVLSAQDLAGPVFRAVEASMAKLNGTAGAIEQRFGTMGSAFNNLGTQVVAFIGTTVGLAATLERFRAAVDGMDKLNDLADFSGASVENLSALEDIAARTGTSLDSVGTSLVKFNAVLNDAKPGSQAANILQRIGLSADELRKLDPAEALRRVAVALSQFANDGDRARVVQELFGKSVREIAPFLNNLAQAGTLNAKVTTEQAAAAEKFNQQLAAFTKNSEDAARAIVSKALPAINEWVRSLKAYDGILGSIKDRLGMNEQGQLENRAESLRSQVSLTADRLARMSEELRRDPGNDLLAGRVEKARGRLADLQRQAGETADSLKALANKNDPSLNERIFGFGNRPGAQNRIGPALPDLAKSTAAAAKFDDYAEQLRQSIGKLADETPIVKLAKLNAQLAALDELLAAGFDPSIARQIRTSLEGLTTVEIPADEMARLAEVTQLLAQTPTGRLDELVSLEEKLSAAYSQGAITAADYEEALQILEERFNQLIEPADQAFSEMSKFAEQAQRNIQNALGDTLFKTMSGSFDDIGKLWGDLLKRMLAEAIAVDLNNAIFKQDKTGGVGDLFSGLGSLFGGFFANGGSLGAGKWGIAGEAGPEVVRGPATIVPMSRVAATNGAPVHQTFNIGQGVTPEQLQMAVTTMGRAVRAQVKGEVFQSIRRDGAFA